MRRALAVTSLLLVLGSSTFAATSRAAASGRTVPAPTTPARTPASAAKRAAAKQPASGLAPAQGKRVLEDVHIEGEIPVPQVLFITARDQRRFMDFRHRRYLRTSREFGERTVLPTWMVVTDGLPSDARKEKTP